MFIIQIPLYRLVSPGLLDSVVAEELFLGAFSHDHE
jgi:hypothetical protein